MNSKPSGDSEWIFGVVIARVSYARTENGEGEGGGKGEAGGNRGAIGKMLSAREETKILTRWYLKERKETRTEEGLETNGWKDRGSERVYPRGGESAETEDTGI